MLEVILNCTILANSRSATALGSPDLRQTVGIHPLDMPLFSMRCCDPPHTSLAHAKWDVPLSNAKSPLFYAVSSLAFKQFSYLQDRGSRNCTG